MKNDPIVDEIHKVRAQMLDACNGDLDKLMDQYKTAEDSDKDRLISQAKISQRKNMKFSG